MNIGDVAKLEHNQRVIYNKPGQIAVRGYVQQKGYGGITIAWEDGKFTTIRFKDETDSRVQYISIDEARPDIGRGLQSDRPVG